ncbi:MAG TPA: isochorismatase family protein [Candidatus Hydrogenedentes bacterium]|nr:isochorismatase family protein [Candidatus Hydrogenedentota bacterium]
MRFFPVCLLLCFLCAWTARAQEAPLRVCLVSGSFEYDSDTALAVFKAYLEENFAAECVLLRADGWENLPGLEALDTCDTALFYTRRLEISGDQLDRVKRYCAAGKPLVAVRTASHGFQKWLAFDREVLGGNYKGHFGEGPSIETFLMPAGKKHPVFEGVEPFRSRYSLYRTKPVARDADVLMTGSTPDSGGRQPVAWTRVHNGGRVFYTALGGVGDFENRAFARMVANALFWTANRAPALKPPAAPAPREKRAGGIGLSLRSRDAGDLVSEGRAAAAEWPAAETAVIVCDMWDKHWCDFASERVGEMAPRMDEFLRRLRAAGVQIIHCPSETLGFYQDTPQCRRMRAAPAADLPAPRDIQDPPLPIDDSDGGCPGEEDFYPAWTRQHAALTIAPEDGISDNGREVYNYLRQEGIRNLLYVGVHTNMCVLNRTFGIRQMTRWGFDCALVRDLTDTMYNPAMPPKVPHDEGTELVVRHIEAYWCPSVTSGEIVPEK